MNTLLTNISAKVDLGIVPGGAELAADVKAKMRTNGHAKPKKRHGRGKNRAWVLKVVKAAEGPIGATEIKNRVLLTEGVDLAYSSVRNAVLQLKMLGQVFDADNGRFTAGKQMTLPVETERASI